MNWWYARPQQLVRADCAHLFSAPHLVMSQCHAGGLKSAMEKYLYHFTIQSPSHVRLFATPWTAAHQASLPLIISQSLPKFMSIPLVMPSHSLMPSSPAFNLSQHQVLFQWVSCSHQIYQMTKILELQLQHAEGMLKEWRNIHSFQWIFRVDFDWLIGSLCCPRDSQESSPALQFEDINSLAFSLLYSPALPTVCDHWVWRP